MHTAPLFIYLFILCSHKILTVIASEESWQPALQFKLAVLYGGTVSLSLKNSEYVDALTVFFFLNIHQAQSLKTQYDFHSSEFDLNLTASISHPIGLVLLKLEERTGITRIPDHTDKHIGYNTHSDHVFYW